MVVRVGACIGYGRLEFEIALDNKNDYSLEIQVTLGSYTNSMNAII
jgi:hypothetical protein